MDLSSGKGDQKTFDKNMKVESLENPRIGQTDSYHSGGDFLSTHIISTSIEICRIMSLKTKAFVFDLYSAILNDDVEIAEYLVTEGWKVNVMPKITREDRYVFPYRNTVCALDLALRGHHYDLAGKIVDAGAKPSPKGIMHMYRSLLTPMVPREERLHNIDLLKKMLCLGFRLQPENIYPICNELKKRTNDPLYNHLVECADLIASTKVCVPSLKVLARNQVRIYVTDSADIRHLKQKLQELEIPEDLKTPLILKHSSDEFR